MKIAAAQTVVSADIAVNGEAIRQAMTNAAGRGARLALFCEGALSGYAKSEIKTPSDWGRFDWERQDRELRAVAALCGQVKMYAVVGAAYRLKDGYSPFNSLYVFSDEGRLLTRYDKRFLSNTELGGWYTPGAEAIVFEVDGYRFGCAICIESQFPEVFAEYERLGVDGVLFASMDCPDISRLPCEPMPD